MKSLTYRRATITAHAGEVGGGSTGFQYRYRGEVQCNGAQRPESPEIAEFDALESESDPSTRS